MKKAHFIGICGAGMSAVATLLAESGWKVSGSDEGCHPPISTYLHNSPLIVYDMYDKNNIPDDIDLFVIGGSAKLSSSTNAEVKHAHALKVPKKRFPEVLEQLTQETHNVIVAGSYGKSTITALLSWLLVHAGKDPSYFIGAIPLNFDAHAHKGSGKLFILEGDEYPTSQDNLQPKFLYMNPDDVILTSGEHDHVNVYETEDDYLTPFKKLLQKVPDDGLVMACTDNAHVATLAKERAGNVITYGLIKEKSPSWSARNIKLERKTRFVLVHNNTKVVELETTMLGRHNIQNIVGVAGLLLEREFLTPEEIREGLTEFKGIERRLDKKTGDNASVAVYEGFGSSRKKSRAAIQAIKEHFPDKRLVVMFEPHAFSWRNRAMISWYDDVFEGSDVVFVYKPPAIAKSSHDQLTLEDIVDRIPAEHHAQPFHSPEEGMTLVRENIAPGDIVLILTSGNMDGLVERVPTFIETSYPQKS